jgi:arsenate reductase
MCTGEIYKHPGSDAIRILFLDDFNSCQSQMAEAIAYSLNQPKFIFSSAGINPKAVCRQTIDFMKTKGIDLSRNAPKTLHEIPNLEHYQVIIALSETAASTIQQLPKKVIFLDWSVINPVDKNLSALAASEAYEEAYVFIKEQITDLLNAINDHDSKDQGVI